MVERSRSDLVNAVLLVVLAILYTAVELTDDGPTSTGVWSNIAATVVLAVLHVLRYTSPTFRRWMNDPAVLARIAAGALVLAAVLYVLHGTTPAWMVALAGVVSALGAVGKHVEPRPFRANRLVQLAALAVAVGFVAFGTTFLAGPIDHSAVAAAFLSAVAGLVIGWQALRWRRSFARTK